MLGFTTVAAGTSLKFSPGITRWDQKMSLYGKSSNRQTIYAAVAEAAPPSVDGRRRPANLYEVLNVKYNASPTEIKTAYRALAKIYHPDVAAAVVKHPEESFDGRDFIEIHNAYATLSDPAAREMYDLTLRTRSSRKQPLDSSYSAPSGYSRRVGFYTTRRWETDQCW